MERVFSERLEHVKKVISSNGNNNEAIGNKMESFIDILALEYINDPKTFSKENVYSELQTFLAAGFETVSVGLTWTFALISNHPEVQEKNL